jgi:hypothetical protein
MPAAVGRLLLAWLLSVTGVLKLLWPTDAGGTLVARLGLSPAVLGVVEVFIAVALLGERWRRLGLIGAAGLLASIGLLFLFGGSAALVNCGCLGAALRLSAIEHGALVVAMAGLLLLAVRAPGRETR